MWVEMSDGYFYENPIIYGIDWFFDPEDFKLHIRNEAYARKSFNEKVIAKRLRVIIIGVRATGPVLFPPKFTEESARSLLVIPKGPINIDVGIMLPTPKVKEMLEGGDYCWNFFVARSRLETFIKGNDSVVINNLLKIMEPHLTVWTGDRKERIEKLRRQFKKILKKQEGERIKLTRKSKCR